MLDGKLQRFAIDNGAMLSKILHEVEIPALKGAHQRRHPVSIGTIKEFR